MRFPGRSADRENVATTISRSAVRPLDQALHKTTLSKWMAVAAVIGAGLACLTVASHVRGTTAPITQIHTTPVAATIVPASIERAHTAAALSSARPASPGIPDARFLLGFLEFENDPDPPPE